MIVNSLVGVFYWRDEVQDECNREVIYSLTSGFPSQKEWEQFQAIAAEYFIPDKIFVGVEQALGINDIPYLTFRSFAGEYAQS